MSGTVIVRATGACYLVCAGVGTWIAVRDHLPASFAGWDLATDSVFRDFLIGPGTALSAPFALLLLLLTLLILAGRPDAIGRTALFLLAALALGFVVGMVGEPIAHDVLTSPADHSDRTVIVALNIALPVLMLATILGSLARRPPRRASAMMNPK